MEHFKNHINRLELNIKRYESQICHFEEILRGYDYEISLGCDHTDESYGKLIGWCKKCFNNNEWKDIYYADSLCFYFKNEEDAVAFKLKWS